MIQELINQGYAREEAELVVAENLHIDISMLYVDYVEAMQLVQDEEERQALEQYGYAEISKAGSRL